MQVLELGIFVVLIGIATLFYSGDGTRKICAWTHHGNIRNMGILGLLVGFSPCLPLLGILNYIVIISRDPLDAVLFTFVFGVGTVLSPFILLILLSGKLAGWLSHDHKLKTISRVVCGSLLIYLGTRTVVSFILGS